MELKDIGTLAITVLVTVIIIALMGTVLGSFQSGLQDVSTTHANVTLTWGGNNTAMDLQATRITSANVYNNGTPVNQGANWTLTAASLIVTNQSNNIVQWVTNAINVSYNYNIGSVAYNTSNFGLSTVSVLSSYLPLIGLVSIAAVIVGIVLVMFRRRSA